MSLIAETGRITVSRVSPTYPRPHSERWQRFVRSSRRKRDSVIAARPNPGQFSFSGRGVGRTHKDYRSNGRSTLVLAVRSSLLSSPEGITSCRRTWSDIHRFGNSLQPSSMLQRSETRRIKKRKEMLLLASLMSLKTPDTWVLLGSSLCTLFRVLGCLGMDVHVVQTIFSIRFFLVDFDFSCCAIRYNRPL